jgi:hypothetical protein
MKILSEYKKNGYTFHQYKREGDFAIFKGTQEGNKHENWEVIQIQSHDGRNIMGNEVAAAEYAPSNEQWGAKGWTHSRLEDAEEKLKKLVSNGG